MTLVARHVDRRNRIGSARYADLYRDFELLVFVSARTLQNLFDFDAPHLVANSSAPFRKRRRGISQKRASNCGR